MGKRRVRFCVFKTRQVVAWVLVCLGASQCITIKECRGHWVYPVLLRMRLFGCCLYEWLFVMLYPQLNV